MFLGDGVGWPKKNDDGRGRNDRNHHRRNALASKCQKVISVGDFDGCKNGRFFIPPFCTLSVEIVPKSTKIYPLSQNTNDCIICTNFHVTKTIFLLKRAPTHSSNRTNSTNCGNKRNHKRANCIPGTYPNTIDRYAHTYEMTPLPKCSIEDVKLPLLVVPHH